MNAELYLFDVPERITYKSNVMQNIIIININIPYVAEIMLIIARTTGVDSSDEW